MRLTQPSVSTPDARSEVSEKPKVSDRAMRLTQNVNVKGLAVLHNSVSRIVSTLRAAAQLYSAARNDIHNLALAFVTPLRS